MTIGSRSVNSLPAPGPGLVTATVPGRNNKHAGREEFLDAMKAVVR
jgi:hypothetical protein